MKKGILIGLVLLLALATTGSVVRAQDIYNIVRPKFEDHEGELECFDAASAEFSEAETVLGDQSVKMYIPQTCIPEGVFYLGVNAETRLATGMSRQRGLAFYDGISFKAKPGVEGRHGALNVSLILYDNTNDVWVSMLTYDTTCSADGDGWQTCVAPVGAGWDAWAFTGESWPDALGYPDAGYVSLADWDEYIADNDLDAKVRKVNIQFGYDPNAWGTVYVDGLSFANRTLDFEGGH